MEFTKPEINNLDTYFDEPDEPVDTVVSAVDKELSDRKEELTRKKDELEKLLNHYHMEQIAESYNPRLSNIKLRLREKLVKRAESELNELLLLSEFTIS
jgi:hypothetical protein